MPFERPTLQEIIDRETADITTRLEGADPQPKRGNLAVLPRAHAGAVHGLYGYLDFMARQIMPDTAEAEYLERWAGIWGLARKQAAQASGDLVLGGAAGTVIPAGWLVLRSDDAQFASTAEAVLPAPVPVAALNPGAAGNTAAGALFSLASPIAGADATATVAAGGIGGGADAETDPALLARLLARVQAPPHGGKESDYVAWALEVPGVTRAWAYANRLGAGTVGVAFLVEGSPTGPIPNQDELDAVAAHIEPLRPVTAAVTVFALNPLPVDFEIHLAPDNATVRAAVAAELADLLKREALPGESTLLLSHVREAISTAAGEYDHTLTSPAADVEAGAGDYPVMGEITWS